MNVQSKTIKIIASLSVVDESNINYEDTLSNIGIDSLKSVELIVALEDGLNIKFYDSDLDPGALTSVRSIVDLVKKYFDE